MSSQRDLIVIGSGPGGYVAAIRAAQLGLRTTLIEKDDVFGGTCLHRGCIPTKAMLHTAALLDETRRAADFGIRVDDPALDVAAMHDNKDGVVSKNAKGIQFLLRKNKVETVHGFGRLADGGGVEVALADGGTERLEAGAVMLATGSRPRRLGFAPADGKRIIDSDHILRLEAVPESLAILGAGAVGVEFASIFRSYGSEVTLIEMLPRVLPLEDEEVSAELAKALRRRGIRVLTEAKVESVETKDDGVTLGLAGGDDLAATTLLIAVGREPLAEDLGLEQAGVEVERGFVKVDSRMRTTAEGVWAIGDLVDTPQLAHVASAEGILVAEQIAGLDPQPIDYDRVPSCTYSHPEVASVGLSEQQARDRGYRVEAAKFPFSASGKAALAGHTEGFVKMVREVEHDELLGVHIVGYAATELLAEACVAMRLEATTEDIVRTIHAHPTLSEAVAEAAHAVSGHALHI